MPNRHARLEGVSRPEAGTQRVSLSLESRLAHAIRDERRRTARDLHAGVLQRLAATRMLLSTAMETGGGDARRLGGLAAGVDAMAAELRSTISSREPPLLATAGIGTALEAAADASPQRVEMCDGLARRHPARVELAVYFACREAIQNAAKHAGASAVVRVDLADSGAGADFRVADNGAGFVAGDAHGGAGLFNISERVRSAGGSVDIASTPGFGTIVSGFVPDLLDVADATQPISHPALAADELRRQIILETDAERRRIMRDLHDGAQQQLVALRVKVTLATEVGFVSDTERTALERTGRELDAAIAELRDLARGLLAAPDVAVAPALRSVTRHWPMEVRVRERNVGRADRDAQATVFGCVLETLQHARAQRERASSSSAVVTLVQASDALHFVVRGRGRAFDPARPAAHASAEHVGDRASAAGGSLSYEPQRDGVVIRGSIPLSSVA